VKGRKSQHHHQTTRLLISIDIGVEDETLARVSPFSYPLFPTKHNSLEKHLRNKANNLLGLFVHKLNVGKTVACAFHT